MAVFAGEQGLDVIGPLIEQAHRALKPGGWLAMEIGYSMRDAVLNLLHTDVGGCSRRAGFAGNTAGHSGPKTMIAGGNRRSLHSGEQKRLASVGMIILS